MADEDKPEYAVGFGKPPRHTRFRKGQSGNPKGRPRGSKNLATIMEKVLKEPVVISENGKRRRITKREALIKQLVNKAIAGDPRSIKLLLAELREIDDRLGTDDGGIPLEAVRRVMARLDGEDAQ
jgi:Family of unknown function (DUF5681)